jgi:hypothetical protein
VRLRERLSRLVRSERLDDLVSVGALPGRPADPPRSRTDHAPRPVPRSADARSPLATAAAQHAAAFTEDDLEMEDLPARRRPPERKESGD